MYNAMDIAHYIINKSIEANKPISNLKLQKILYYTQAAFLVERDTMLFNNNILRWRHGPVIREVYDTYKKYGGGDILDVQREYTIASIDEDFNFKVEKITYDENKICTIDKFIINRVLDSNLNLAAWELVDKTHKEEPWKNTSENQIISCEIIKEYFNKDGNIGRIYGGFDEAAIG